MSRKRARITAAVALLGCWGFANLAAAQSPDSTTWNSVSGCTSVQEVEFYLRSFPAGKHARAARECLEDLARGDTPFRFKDGCAGCPELVLIPHGRYTMGSKRSEHERSNNEGPRRRVIVEVPFAVSVFEVTRGEYGRFVKATRHKTADSCWTLNPGTGRWKSRRGFSWEAPGYDQTDQDPVVCVGWDDAKAYVEWLSDESGEDYRLLSESEWEYVARAGDDTPRYWGKATASQCRHENGRDRAFAEHFRAGRYPNMERWRRGRVSCGDGFVHTAPVGSFEKPNRFGVHDILGNAREWVEDCWNETYANAPRHAMAWTSQGDCRFRMVRGGSWANAPKVMRAANRLHWRIGNRSDVLGFRVARTLEWGN